MVTVEASAALPSTTPSCASATPCKVVLLALSAGRAFASEDCVLSWSV